MIFSKVFLIPTQLFKISSLKEIKSAFVIPNTGTHKGEYRGLGPSGKKFKTISVEIYRIVNGKIVEGWTILDWFTHLESYKQQGIVEYKGYPEEGVF